MRTEVSYVGKFLQEGIGVSKHKVDYDFVLKKISFSELSKYTSSEKKKEIKQLLDTSRKLYKIHDSLERFMYTGSAFLIEKRNLGMSTLFVIFSSSFILRADIECEKTECLFHERHFNAVPAFFVFSRIEELKISENKEDGTEMVLNCPQCKENTYYLISFDERIFYCFTCFHHEINGEQISDSSDYSSEDNVEIMDHNH